MSQVGYEFKDRDLEFLNQPDSFIPFTAKIRSPKPKQKSISRKFVFLRYTSIMET